MLVPEDPVDMDAVVELILENRSNGKNHNLIVVAEGVGHSQELAAYIEKITGISAGDMPGILFGSVNPDSLPAP